jgi:hypothetical protein
MPMVVAYELPPPVSSLRARCLAQRQHAADADAGALGDRLARS